jgi:Glucose / Sorbosone dehydrogenase
MPFLTVPANSSGERGLLRVAFDPNFSVNQFIYFNYTAITPTIHNRVSRFSISRWGTARRDRDGGWTDLSGNGAGRGRHDSANWRAHAAGRGFT